MATIVSALTGLVRPPGPIRAQRDHAGIIATRPLLAVLGAALGAATLVRRRDRRRQAIPPFASAADHPAASGTGIAP